MITFKKDEFYAHPSADMAGDSSLGNRLFMIASTIGIAIKNGYDFGFPEWHNQRFFSNPLPEVEFTDYTPVDIPWGYHDIEIEDYSSIYGYLQSPRYFEHCMEVIRYYLTPSYQTEPIKNAIIIHYRAYYELLYGTLFKELQKKYYINALKKLPDLRVVVVTDNIPRAKACLGEEFEYVSNTAIQDFYLLCNADYIVMSNSSFSAMAALIAGCPTVAPYKWFANGQSAKDIYHKSWIKV
jgi:hypothetical protein